MLYWYWYKTQISRVSIGIQYKYMYKIKRWIISIGATYTRMDYQYIGAKNTRTDFQYMCKIQEWINNIGTHYKNSKSKGKIWQQPGPRKD